jgi:large subunit ribosomal protein L10
MSNPRPEKVAEVEELQNRLQSAAVVILTDYRGLSVGEIGALRAKLRDAAIDYRVTKNTLLGRAAELAGVAGLEPYLVGPTAVVFGQDDPGAPARILQEFIRQYRKLEIKGGVVEGQALDSRGVQSLASLPTKLELMASLLGVIQGPMRGLVTVLTGPQRGLVTALDALRKQREEAAPAASVAAAPVTASEAAAVMPETEAPVAASDTAPAASASEASVGASEPAATASATEAPVDASEAAGTASASEVSVGPSETVPAASASEEPVAVGKPETVTQASEAPAIQGGTPAAEANRTGS